MLMAAYGYLYRTILPAGVPHWPVAYTAACPVPAQLAVQLPGWRPGCWLAAGQPVRLVSIYYLFW